VDGFWNGSVGCDDDDGDNGDGGLLFDGGEKALHEVLGMHCILNNMDSSGMAMHRFVK